MAKYTYVMQIENPIEVPNHIEVVFDSFTGFKNFTLLTGVRDASRWQTAQTTPEDSEKGGTMMLRVGFGDGLYEYPADIETEERPKRIVWKSLDGSDNGGELNFNEATLAGTSRPVTRIRVTINYPGVPRFEVVSSEQRRDELGLDAGTIVVFCHRFPPYP